ncbi:glycosyltransferase family 39 protein [Candidatus Gottesmanbacteria bacterium]|nr:glycosyltransferase family 39 protein [Candidatus Gottesmanbacteria bacterium]
MSLVVSAFQFLLSHTPLLYLTQSIWRDEAFSILAAKEPLLHFLPTLTFEPPLYYILLHFWIKLFGTSEVAVRSLSLVGFLIACSVVVVWSEKRFGKHFLSWVTPLTFILNPMLLYYAFEARAYGWFMAFIALALYGYLEKKWIIFTTATILGFYTHVYMIFFPIVTTLHFLITEYRHISLKHVFQQKYIQSIALVSLCMLPWIIVSSSHISKLSSSWYFPVDLHLITSVLGNMFLGYEGTPWYLWGWTAFGSLVLLGLMAILLISKHQRKTNLFILLLVAAPLTLVLGFSLLVKPMFTNRYFLPVTFGEIFLVVSVLEMIKNKSVQVLLSALYVGFLLWVNIWYPPLHPKLPIRDTITQINSLKKPSDVVFATSPLIFFETIYYSTHPESVYLYNPDESAFPWYVGDSLVKPSQMARDLPLYPTRAFLVHEDGSYTLMYRSPIQTTALKLKK